MVNDQKFTQLVKLVNEAHNNTTLRNWNENISSTASQDTFVNNWSNKIFSERNQNNLPVNENQQNWTAKISSQNSKVSTYSR